jgi:hypothetical protein
MRLHKVIGRGRYRFGLNDCLCPEAIRAGWSVNIRGSTRSHTRFRLTSATIICQSEGGGTCGVSEKVEGVVDRLCVVVVWVCCDTGGGAVRVTNDRRDQTREEARCYLYRSIRDERLGVVYLRGWIWSEGCDKVDVGC